MIKLDETYKCPSSWAIVKALCKPLSWTTVQDIPDLQAPAIGANPKVLQ